MVTLLSEVRPDEVYNLAAQSHVEVSFDEPEHTADATGTGTIRMLEAVRLAGSGPASTRRRPRSSSGRLRRRRVRRRRSTALAVWRREGL